MSQAIAERMATVPGLMGMLHEAAAARVAKVDGQVIVEVQVRRIEGPLSEPARRELLEVNLALLEGFAAALRQRLDATVGRCRTDVSSRPSAAAASGASTPPTAA